MLSVSETGSREGIIKHIEELKAAEGLSKEQAELDGQLIAAAKCFLISEIKALPDEFNGAHVVAEGNATKGGRTFSANISPRKLKL